MTVGCYKTVAIRVTSDIISSLHPLEIEVLNRFKSENKSLLWTEILEKTGLKESQLRTAIEWLLHKGLIVTETTGVEEIVTLTKTGISYAEKGIPEKRIVQILTEETQQNTMARIAELLCLEKEEVGSVTGFLKKHKDISIESGGILKLIAGNSAPYIEKKQNLINKVFNEKQVMLTELTKEEQELARSLYRKRGTEQGVFRIDEKPVMLHHLTEQGKELILHLEENLGDRKTEISQITPELLQEGKWKGVNFRKYNISLNPPRLIIGKKHPYRQFLDWVRQKFISLGFKEMKGPVVETEFWDMDALFMPQFHSARNIHDVYYIKKPEYCREIEEPYLSNVAACHENGGATGSEGWRYKFDRKKTKRLVLRSQGTALSARTLAGNPEIPGKYFGIARCFRYDQIDATHGTDFFQSEGIVLDESINFPKLLGLLNLFAKEIAKAKKTKFTPAYFPFTEPSVELHVEHPVLGWIELGGAGIFRPEVTLPLGIDVPVIAWGLGIDRMAMVSLGINDIRQLFSHDMNFIRNSKAVI